MAKAPSDQYSKKETDKRVEAAMRAALTTPPKPHEDMKIRKGKASPKKKARKP